MGWAKKPTYLPCLLEIKVLTWYRGCGAENPVTQKLLGLNQELIHGTLDTGPIGCIMQSKALHMIARDLLM